jgi:hypothetical protein
MMISFAPQYRQGSYSCDGSKIASSTSRRSIQPINGSRMIRQGKKESFSSAIINLHNAKNMVLITLGILALFILFVGSLIFVSDQSSKKAIDIAKDMHESNKRTLELSTEILKSNKELLAFIDKNIHERVVYAATDNPYQNEHKFVPEEKEVKLEEEEVEIGPDELAISMEHDKNNNKSEGE